MAYPMPDPFRQVVRGSYTLSYKASASSGGQPIPRATGLGVLGGSIEDDSNRDNRRTASITLPPLPGLFEDLSGMGTEVRVTGVVGYPNGQSVELPMGVFDVTNMGRNGVDSPISLTCTDLWEKVKRARFLRPAASTPGLLVVEQIALLINDALGAGAAVTVTATSTARVGALFWERDRDKAILDLAKSIGAWVYFDRLGTPTIADVPNLGEPDWSIDAASAGVLLTAGRTRSRERTFNVVVASGSATDGTEPFPPVIVWDSDPASPTYAGTNPENGDNAGPFGVVPYFYESPLLLDSFQAQVAARSILSRTVGVASQVSLESVPNPAIDAADVLSVLLPDEGATVNRLTERHVVDKVTHPLTVGQPTVIEGRSTRTDEYT